MSIRSVVIVLPLLVACADSAYCQPNNVADTGIRGRVTVSPIRPGPAKKGSEFSNAAPFSNATFRVMSNERVATTFTSDAQGHFRVTLKPGHYSILLAENRFPKPCGPFEIDVEQGKITEVEWHCDSGMR